LDRKGDFDHFPPSFKFYQIDDFESHRSRLFSETVKANEIQIANKKIRINSAVFSEDEDEEEEKKDEEKEKPTPMALSLSPSESLDSPGLSTIPLEDIERLMTILERTQRGVEQMKNEPSSLGIIPIICQILDDIMEFGFSLRLQNSSPVLFVSLCLREFQLSSFKMISDDQFLRLVESYVDINTRPNQNISLFLIGVVLQRVRKLQSPASRVLVKAIEICMANCLETFNFFLSRVLTLPSKNDLSQLHSNETSEEVTLHSFQYELVQRIVRQNSYSDSHKIDSLLSHMMAPSENLSLIANIPSLHLKNSRDYLLLDSLLNSGPFPSLPLQPVGMSQYLSLCLNHRQRQLITSSFPITQDSLKFLSSVFLSVYSFYLQSSHLSS
jgi:hypothetical protein